MTAALVTAPEPTTYGEQRRWHARLQLAFTRMAHKTCLSQMSFHGPLRVQRPFYPEGALCHVYLLHPPGGLVSGDQLGIDVVVNEGAQALLTTPSAGKIYHSDSCNLRQQQQVSLKVEAGASCEWLPQETIVFDGANGELFTRIDLQSGAGFIGWDIYCLGRPAGKSPFASGQLVQRLQLYREGVPLLLERQCVQGGSLALQSRWGYQGQTVSGTLLCALPEGWANDPSRSEALVEKLRELLARQADSTSLISVTQRMGVLIVRYLGAQAETCRELFTACWQCLRPEVLGRPAVIPRIWAT